MNDIIPPRRGQQRSTIRERSSERLPVIAYRSQMTPITIPKQEPKIVEAPTLESKVAEMPVQPVMLFSPSHSNTPTLHRRLTKSAIRADVLERALPAKKSKIRKSKRFSPRQIIFVTLAAIILISTGYVGYDTWATSNQVKTQLGTTSKTSTTAADVQQTGEGTDTTPLPVSALAKYAVAPDLPRALYINKLGIAARVLPMAVNADDSIQAPTNIYDSGWYTGSVKPGDDGAVFIDGHSSADHGALFGNLDKLVVGDQIQIEKGDGTKITYKVVHTDIVDKDAVDMSAMLKPYGNATKGLNLITCAGDWIPSQDTLTKRILVYAEQTS